MISHFVDPNDFYVVKSDCVKKLEQMKSQLDTVPASLRRLFPSPAHPLPNHSTPRFLPQGVGYAQNLRQAR